MKKIKLVFKAIYEDGRQVKIIDQVNEGCEWVLNGEGKATRKFDGTCCAIINGVFYKRYDAKIGKNSSKSKTPPDDYIPCQDPDPVTGHWPCWVKIDPEKSEDKYFIEGYNNYILENKEIEDGTYELCGPKINGNHEHFDKHVLVPHGCEVYQNVERSFEGIREFLKDKDIEGLVFHRGNGDMAKIRKKDFFGRR